MTAIKNVKRKHLTQDDYDQIKLLAAAGLKHSLISEVTQRSSGTVARVMSSKDFTDYRKVLSEVNAVYHAKARERAGLPPKGQKAAKTTMPTEGSEDVPQGRVMNHSEVTMERIANALERLADAWEAHPKRTGLFK